jgi:hypothetical protein
MEISSDQSSIQNAVYFGGLSIGRNCYHQQGAKHRFEDCTSVRELVAGDSSVALLQLGLD